MIDIAALVSSHEILYEILAKALQEYDGEALIRYQAARCYSNDGDYEQSIELFGILLPMYIQRSLTIF